LVRQRRPRHENRSASALPTATSWSSPKSANQHATNSGASDGGQETTSPYLAMKVIQKFSAFHSETSLQHALDERLVLQLASSHPFVMSLHSAFQSDKALYLLTEFCSGGDLRGLLSRSPGGRFSEESAVQIFAQIVLALEHIHSLNVVYRDLKPENILMAANGDVRLCDFGLSKVLTTGRWGRTKSFCGTTGYMSPEIVRRSKPYGIASDLWSLGVLFYRALVGRGPFDTPHKDKTSFARSLDDSETFRKIMHDDVTYPSFLSNAAVELLKGLIEKDEEKRLNLEEVKESMFFSGVDWDKMLEQGKKMKRGDVSFENCSGTSVCSEASFGSGEVVMNLENFDLKRVDDVVMDKSELMGSKVTEPSGSSASNLRSRRKRVICRVPGLHRLVPKHEDSTTIVGYAFSSHNAARCNVLPSENRV
jgi:serine/threonine protein kinase